MLLTDEQLMHDICQGSLPAFELLIQRWDKRMLNYFSRCIGNRVEAEDLRQELFLKIYQNRRTFNPKKQFKSWIYRIGTNLIIDKFARKKTPTMEPIEENNQHLLSLSSEQNSCEKASMNEINERLNQVLKTVPHEERIVLIMKHFEDLTFNEISNVLQIPESTIKTRLYRGLSILRDKLKPLGIIDMDCIQVS